LQKEPARRYPSALALAEDLHRFLAGEPIQARPVAVWQRLARAARRRPVLVGRALGALALLCVLLTAAWYFCVAEQLARRRAEERYRQFIQRRNEAIFHGLLAPDQGDLFQGAAASDHLNTAETAAREALALAGIRPDAATAADCYTLLLVLAGIQES